MRAAVFHSDNRQLAVETVPDPVPAEGQVVVKVHRCGICSSDLHMAEGHMISFEEGAIPGHEVSGEVVALGPGAQGVAIGDPVAVLPHLTCGQCLACRLGDAMGCEKFSMFGSGPGGGYAEFVLTNPGWCVPLPRSVGYEAGALVEPLAVALRSAQVSGLGQGDRVLVLGAGPIGLAAAHWARRAGASRVAVAATSRRRAAMAGAVGADAFIVPEEGRTLAEQAAEALGAAPDVVFECAGVLGSLDEAVSAVRRGGTVAAPGFCWGVDRFNGMAAMIKEVTIRYTNMYSRREFEIAVDSLDRGHVEPLAMITSAVDLAGAPAAFEELRGPNSQGKVMIRPW